ncbi:MAG: hypothetical protein Q4F28_05855 [Eubacteriales bacterium]|nr:hypothetical protein [Eubacteriales bacterium]
MGLDIYAGTLARYYTHNWKTAAQQFAEAKGITISNGMRIEIPLFHGAHQKAILRMQHIIGKPGMKKWL